MVSVPNIYLIPYLLDPGRGSGIFIVNLEHILQLVLLFLLLTLNM